MAMKGTLRQHVERKKERVMVVNRALSAFVVGLMAASGGCHHKDAGPSDGTPSIPPRGVDASVSAGRDAGVSVVGGTVCEESSPTYCAHYFRCDPKGAKEYYGSVDNCAVQDASTCRWLGSLPDVSPKVMESWAACNRALAAQSCEEAKLGEALEACRTLAGARRAG